MSATSPWPSIQKFFCYFLFTKSSLPPLTAAPAALFPARHWWHSLGTKFYSLYAQGFARVAACTTETALADPARNAEAVLAAARDCHERGVAVAVFPELTLSGYSIEDLLLQDTVLDAVEDAIAVLLAASKELLPVLVVGAPLRHAGRLYNTALVIHRGRVLGVVPKSYLPTYREFYEGRHIAAGDELRGDITVGGQAVPFGNNLIFAAEDVRGLLLHVEICEDFWVPVPPSALAALAGATVLANLSGSPITIGRAESRRLLAQSASTRCLAAYIYAAAGAGESTTELAWDGQAMIYRKRRAASPRRSVSRKRGASVVADIDLDLLRQERMRQGTFDDNRRTHARGDRCVPHHHLPAGPADRRSRPATPRRRFPFVPADPARLEQDCFEAYNIQVAGLVQRLRATGSSTWSSASPAASIPPMP